MCVCQPNALMCLDVIRAPPSPLSPHSSLCLLLSLRSRAGPSSSSSARPDTQTDPADSRGHTPSAGTRHKTRENTLNICEGRKTTGRIAASHTLSICRHFFFLFPPPLPSVIVFLKRKNKLCPPWKDVKISPDTKLGHKLRPSELHQRTLNRTVRFFLAS